MRWEHLAYTGLGGLIMFLLGILNIVGQVLLMYQMRKSGSEVLFAALLSSSIATVVTSLPLALCILYEVAREAKRSFYTEVMERGYVKFIVLLSCSRVESLAILRLRLCNSEACTWSFPMTPKHFYFVPSIGAYHILVKDIPHVLVSCVQLNEHNWAWTSLSAGGDGSGGGDASQWPIVQWLLSNSPWFAVAFGVVSVAATLLDLVL